MDKGMVVIHASSIRKLLYVLIVSKKFGGGEEFLDGVRRLIEV